MSHVSMAARSNSIDDLVCDLFEANLSAQLDAAFATIAAVSAGRSKGVHAEHLAKVWCIPHDEAAQTLNVMTQSLRHDPDSSLSRNVGTNDCAVRYRKIKSFNGCDHKYPHNVPRADNVVVARTQSSSLFSND